MQQQLTPEQATQNFEAMYNRAVQRGGIIHDAAESQHFLDSIMTLKVYVAQQAEKENQKAETATPKSYPNNHLDGNPKSEIAK